MASDDIVIKRTVEIIEETPAPKPAGPRPLTEGERRLGLMHHGGTVMDQIRAHYYSTITGVRIPTREEFDRGRMTD